MVSKATKLRLRRRLRRSRRQVENLGSQAEVTIDKHVVGRLSRLLHIRRFLLVWFGLLACLSGTVLFEARALSGYYQKTEAVSGGIYTEGVLGDFSTPNPLYATSPVDSAVSHLVFGSLFTYNTRNQLAGELARSWSVDSTGKVYTVTLKPGLTWQDGQPLTAADIVFTYQTIQNPDAQSPLNSSWQNVTIAQKGPLTVTFTLSNPLSSFPYSLTNGIVPKHLLQNVPVSELATANFNDNPVGAGPFSWEALAVAGDTPASRQEQITLTPFTDYALGEPKLKQFTVIAYHSKDLMISSFQAGELNGLAGLESVPSKISGDSNLHIYNLQLTAANMVFFKTTSGVLSDAKVRQALVLAAPVNDIINGLSYRATPVREPLLLNQLGYNPAYAQATGNPANAASLLQNDGWIAGQNGIRSKSGQPLSFNLYAADNLENRYVAGRLQQAWRLIGAAVKTVFQSPTDLQDTVTFHGYDALLYGISIGVDPDVFVYWDGSQASPGTSSGLNFSEYNSSTANESLEAGRTRLNPALRVIKYEPFLQAWQQDAPALGLYQPRFLYITNEPVYSLSDRTINQAYDRFDNVQNWAVRLGKVTD